MLVTSTSFAFWYCIVKRGMHALQTYSCFKEFSCTMIPLYGILCNCMSWISVELHECNVTLTTELSQLSMWVGRYDKCDFCAEDGAKLRTTWWSSIKKRMIFVSYPMHTSIEFRACQQQLSHVSDTSARNRLFPFLPVTWCVLHLTSPFSPSHIYFVFVFFYLAGLMH